MWILRMIRDVAHIVRMYIKHDPRKDPLALPRSPNSDDLMRFEHALRSQHGPRTAVVALFVMGRVYGQTGLSSESYGLDWPPRKNNHNDLN